MNIAFVNPPFLPLYSRTQRSPAVTKGGTYYYPYWLAYACGWAMKHGYNATLYDFIAENKTIDQSIHILKKGTFALIVIDSSTPSIASDIRFVEHVKKKLPNTVVLVVGTHGSALPEETLQLSAHIDAVAIGEYDQTVVDCAAAMTKHKNLSTVKGLCVWKNKKPTKTPPRPPLTSIELDQFPFVSKIYKQFIHIPDYYFAAARHPMVMIITARGCPFACNYCLYWQTLHGKVHRARSAQNVVNEFVYIQQNLPEVKEIVIEDDTFTANIPRVREICKLLIENKSTIVWSANVRAGIDIVTMKLMKRAGCRLLITGFESGDQEVLNNMGKHLVLSMSHAHMKNAREAGLLVHGCFMFGNPGDTWETMNKTLQLAIKLNPDSAQFYPLFVYPGTKSYRWFEKNNLLTTTDYSQWLKSDGQHNTVISLPGIRPEEIVEFCEKAYIRYIFRILYLTMKFKQLMTNPDEGMRSVKSGFKYFSRKLFP